MQSSGGASIVDRIMGVVKLNVPTYEEIEHDESATTQALIVVVAVALAGGIGLLIDGESVSGFIGGVLRAVISWVTFSAVAFFVGTRLIPGEQTSATIGQLMRTLGFAQAPNLAAIIIFIPILGPIVAFAAAIWGIVTAVVAIRQALDTSTGRAIGVGLLSILVLIVIFVILAAIGLALF